MNVTCTQYRTTDIQHNITRSQWASMTVVSHPATQNSLPIKLQTSTRLINLFAKNLKTQSLAASTSEDSLTGAV